MLNPPHRQTPLTFVVLVDLHLHEPLFGKSDENGEEGRGYSFHRCHNLRMSTITASQEGPVSGRQGISSPQGSSCVSEMGVG